MSSIPLEANNLRPPEQQPGVLDMYQKVLSLRSLMNQQQLQQGQLQGQQLEQQGQSQQNQMGALQLKDQQTLRSLAPQFLTKDENGQTTGFDFKGLIQKAGASGVSPALLQQMQVQQADLTTKMAGADEATRNNELGKNKAAYELLESVRGVQDPTQRQQAYQQGLPSLQKAGLDITKLPQQVPLDDASLNAFEAHLGMHAQTIADAQKVADTQKAAADAQKATADAALANIKVNLSKNSKAGDFDTQIDQMMPPKGPNANLGQITKTMVNASLSRGDFDGAQKTLESSYNQVGEINKETNPAVIQARAQQAAMVAKTVEPLRQDILSTFQNNKDARDKIETTVLKPYQDKMSELGELQGAVAQAQSGNIAAARATLYKVIGVAQPQGTHRVAPTEVTGFSGMGSLPQRIQGSIANALSGDPWTPQMVQDIKAFGSSQAQVAQDNLSRGIDNTNKLYGTSVGGGLKQQATPSPSGPPQGATHTAPGSDGKMHYTNAQGKDLGVVQ